MTGGFSFCGTDIAKIGLEYAPNLEDTYVYRPSTAKIFDETFDSHTGGYFYGTNKEPKEFILRCVFEEEAIDRGLMAKIHHMFRVGRTGKLVFSRRPWCSYTAVVTEVDDSQITNYLNGVVTIKMKAYYPFSTCDTLWVPMDYPDFWRAMENSALFEKEKMVPPTSFASPENPLTESNENAPFILANPGTEYCPVGIEIAGYTGMGVTIENITTGQSCRLINMTPIQYDGENSWIYLDSLSGKTLAVENGEKKLSFLNHERGYLNLAPGYPCIRSVPIYTQDGTVYTKTKLYDHLMLETREDAVERFVGKYVWLDNEWHKITGVGNGTDPTMYDALDEHILVLDGKVSDGIRDRTSIYQMNEIVIKPDTIMNITRLNFVYKPTFL